MKDFDSHNHIFGSDNRCQICDAHAPEPPAFLRRQTTDYECAISMLAAQTRAKLELLGKVMELEAQLSDCRAVLRERGHEIWCGSNNCGHLYAGGFCGIGRDAHGPNGAVHEFIARHKCTCGYDRVMGEG